MAEKDTSDQGEGSPSRSEAQNFPVMFKSVMNEMKELKQTVASLLEPVDDGDYEDNAAESNELEASEGLRSLESDKTQALELNKGDYKSHMQLTNASIAELEWWIENMPTVRRSIVRPNPSIVVQTDVSTKGWGAALKQ